jgi:hypothetical protein
MAAAAAAALLVALQMAVFSGKPAEMRGIYPVPAECGEKPGQQY